MSDHGRPEALSRRLERERRARREAEAIAERATGELYSAVEELGRLNAELETANDSIREFVAIASHDIRGPLTVILGTAKLLRGRGGVLSESERTELLTAIERHGERLQRLVDDLLTVSRLEAGAVETHIQEICLVMELERVVHDVGEAQIEIAAAPDLWVQADPDHLQRILFNYLSNAIKYGQPPIAVEACGVNGFVDVRIRDCGEGVPDAFVHRLFAKFARVESEGSDREPGTGLGLSIVRGLAQANGGDAWYEPNVPRGSCFVVRLRGAASSQPA